MALLLDFFRFDCRLVQLIQLWRFRKLARIYNWWLILYWPLEIMLGLIHLIGFSHLLQTMMRLGNNRSISDSERAVGQSMFGSRIEWSLVRVFPASKIARWKKIAFVAGNGIHCYEKLSDRLLIHELTHVFQFQQVGLVYIPRALFAQASVAGYNYGQITDHLDILVGQSGLGKLNYEQQAEFLESLYAHRIGQSLPRSINRSFSNLSFKL